MGMHFNLLEEPWIPCVSHDGHVAELNLRNALVQAHQWREVGGDSPLVTAALYRLLLAVLHRVFGPPGREAWYQLWIAGRVDPTPLDSYFSRWIERFDLFDEQHPFGQAEDPRVRARWAGDLLHETRANDTLFDHRCEADGLAWPPNVAARHLLAMQAFGFAGTKGSAMQFTDAPWTRCVTFLVRGESLFTTLLLNLLVYPPPARVMPHTEADRPCWEAPDPFAPERNMPLGYLDYLTWPNRKLRLHRSDPASPMVTAVSMGPGLRLAPEMHNPFAAYSPNPKTGVAPLIWQEDRALWRDATALLGQRTGRRPAQLDHLAALIEETTLDLGTMIPLSAYGMCTQPSKDKVHFYRSEQLPLPLPLLRQQELVDHLEAALGDAEQARNQLWGAASTLASQVLFHKESASLSTNERQERDQILKAWAPERRYWSALDLPFTTLVTSLPEGPLEARLAWARTVQCAAWDALEAVMAGLPDDPASFKAGVLASGQLGAGLRKALPILEVETERSDTA